MSTSTINCNLCNFDFTNQDQYKQHVDGKRHKKLEQIRLDREQSAKRSLFVSNMKKDTFVKQLEDHFAKYGKISKIVTDNEKNSYAIVEYEHESSVDKALEASSDEHVVNGKHLKVNRREIKEFVSKTGHLNEKKKEALEKLKEEALLVNKLLDKCESFEEQVDRLINHLKIDEEQVKLRDRICDDLCNIFKQFWSEDGKNFILLKNYNLTQ